jgi:hypothetical protein
MPWGPGPHGSDETGRFPALGEGGGPAIHQRLTGYESDSLSTIPAPRRDMPAAVSSGLLPNLPRRGTGLNSVVLISKSHCY